LVYDLLRLLFCFERGLFRSLDFFRTIPKLGDFKAAHQMHEEPTRKVGGKHAVYLSVGQREKKERKGIEE
jgi:hypothetical protein